MQEALENKIAHLGNEDIVRWLTKVQSEFAATTFPSPITEPLVATFENLEPLDLELLSEDQELSSRYKQFRNYINQLATARCLVYNTKRTEDDGNETVEEENAISLVNKVLNEHLQSKERLWIVELLSIFKDSQLDTYQFITSEIEGLVLEKDRKAHEAMLQSKKIGNSPYKYLEDFEVSSYVKSLSLILAESNPLSDFQSSRLLDALASYALSITQFDPYSPHGYFYQSFAENLGSCIYMLISNISTITDEKLISYAMQEDSPLLSAATNIAIRKLIPHLKDNTFMISHIEDAIESFPEMRLDSPFTSEIPESSEKFFLEEDGDDEEEEWKPELEVGFHYLDKESESDDESTFEESSEESVYLFDYHRRSYFVRTCETLSQIALANKISFDSFLDTTYRQSNNCLPLFFKTLVKMYHEEAKINKYDDSNKISRLENALFHVLDQCFYDEQWGAIQEVLDEKILNPNKVSVWYSDILRKLHPIEDLKVLATATKILQDYLLRLHDGNEKDRELAQEYSTNSLIATLIQLSKSEYIQSPTVNIAASLSLLVLSPNLKGPKEEISFIGYVTASAAIETFDAINGYFANILLEPEWYHLTQILEYAPDFSIELEDVDSLERLFIEDLLKLSNELQVTRDVVKEENSIILDLQDLGIATHNIDQSISIKDSLKIQLATIFKFAVYRYEIYGKWFGFLEKGINHNSSEVRSLATVALLHAKNFNSIVSLLELSLSQIDSTETIFEIFTVAYKFGNEGMDWLEGLIMRDIPEETKELVRKEIDSLKNGDQTPPIPTQEETRREHRNLWDARSK